MVVVKRIAPTPPPPPAREERPTQLGHSGEVGSAEDALDGRGTAADEELAVVCSLGSDAAASGLGVQPEQSVVPRIFLHLSQCLPPTCAALAPAVGGQGGGLRADAAIFTPAAGVPPGLPAGSGGGGGCGGGVGGGGLLHVVSKVASEAVAAPQRPLTVDLAAAVLLYEPVLVVSDSDDDLVSCGLGHSLGQQAHCAARSSSSFTDSAAGAKASVQRSEQSVLQAPAAVDHGLASSAATRVAPLPAVGCQASSVSRIPRVGHYHGTLIKKASTYLGEFHNGRQHGQAVEVWNSGTKYKGSYENGQKHGSGKFEWPDSSVRSGEFGYDTASGYDERTTSEGGHLKGTFVRGLVCGEGSYTWPDGRVYVGQWRDGKYHGIGAYEYVKGMQKKGEWFEGKRTRWLDE